MFVKRFYWPDVLLDIQYGKESSETKNFKEMMPKIFVDFNWDHYVENNSTLIMYCKITIT